MKMKDSDARDADKGECDFHRTVIDDEERDNDSS